MNSKKSNQMLLQQLKKYKKEGKSAAWLAAYQKGWNQVNKVETK